jgi:hypothetical protein
MRAQVSAWQRAVLRAQVPQCVRPRGLGGDTPPAHARDPADRKRIASHASFRRADYRTLNFVLSSNVIVFFYSFWMMVADALRMSGRCVSVQRSSVVRLSR